MFSVSRRPLSSPFPFFFIASWHFLYLSSVAFPPWPSAAPPSHSSSSQTMLSFCLPLSTESSATVEYYQFTQARRDILFHISLQELVF